MANDPGGVSEAIRASIEARLDAVDRLLLGFIPRHERLAIVRGLEDRLRSLAANAPSAITLVGPAEAAGVAATALERPRDPLEELALAAAGEEPVEPRRERLPVNVAPQTLPTPAPQRLPRVVRPLRPRRSKLALLSTLLGVAAAGLLFTTPLVYLAAMAFDELLGQTGAIVGLGSYVALILLCSTGAIVAGLVALWRLSQLQPSVTGRGWAISGLCAAPIPFAAACLMAMIFGFQMADGLQIQATTSYAVDAPAPTDGPATEPESPAVGPTAWAPGDPADASEAAALRAMALRAMLPDGPSPSTPPSNPASEPDPRYPVVAPTTGGEPTGTSPSGDAQPKPALVPPPRPVTPGETNPHPVVPADPAPDSSTGAKRQNVPADEAPGSEADDLAPTGG